MCIAHSAGEFYARDCRKLLLVENSSRRPAQCRPALGSATGQGTDPGSTLADQWRTSKLSSMALHHNNATRSCVDIGPL